MDAASAGDTVNIEAGTYIGQVAVVGKAITLSGAGEGQTITEAPATLSTSTENAITYGGSTKQAVIAIQGVDAAAGVTVTGLTVNGASNGDAVVPGNDYVGIGVYDSNATINTVAVTGVEDATFDGDQRGRAIFVGNDAGTHTVTVENSIVGDYQKNGIDVRGDGLTALISDNTITGAGVAGVNGQNGIVVLGGAVGAVTGNVIGGNVFGGTDPDSFATGVLLYDAGAGTTISGNTIGTVNGVASPNDAGVEIEENDAGATYVISNNSISNSTEAGVLYVRKAGGTQITGNTFADNATGVDQPG